jgi:hypothetical protein
MSEKGFSKAYEAKLRRATEKRLAGMHAIKLAAADFYYSMDPDRTAVICRIDPVMADKLRKSKPYLEKIETLKQQMDAKLDVTMERDVSMIRARMASLVPEAIEKLSDQLQRDDVLGLQAAREVLDRDGRLPKVSRVQTTIEDKTGLHDVDDKTLAEFGHAKKADTIQ